MVTQNEGCHGRHDPPRHRQHVQGPAGDLVRDTDGYGPPDRRHPRIMTAMGSGSEAALRASYAARVL
ncbi:MULTISPECIES: hypothetical protein [Streptomyces]|uniref:hypothetical protein n=1 Tax=Streptomyces TaxID=1883 RepID=UPI00359C340C